MVSAGEVNSSRLASLMVRYNQICQGLVSENAQNTAWVGWNTRQSVGYIA